jgi:protein-tyrosine phosphatase
MGALTRGLAWDACRNARDLGGLPGALGETQTRRIVRSDTVGALTRDGWAALESYGVRTILDLRFATEVAADRQLADGAEWKVDDVPRRPATADRPVVTVHVPLLGEWDAVVDRQFEEVAAAERDEAAAVRAVYLHILDRFGANVATTVREVARADAGAVLVHCHAGKDRTGIVVALLLRLAGVDAATIADDYAVSAVNLEPVLNPWIEGGKDDAARERRRRLGLSPRQTMLDVLEAIDERWGGVETYLRRMGASDADLDAARARLLL